MNIPRFNPYHFCGIAATPLALRHRGYSIGAATKSVTGG
jgi:hypothetical protein